MTAVYIAAGWGAAMVLVLVFVLGLCAAAARGEDLGRQLLGPASSDDDIREDQEFGVLISFDSARIPHERRHA